MNGADLIARMATGSYVVTRRAAATTDSHGRKVAGATSSFTIIAVIVPASGRDLQRLPEGRRTQETRQVITSTPLLVGGQGSANEADLVAVDGQTWEVQLVENWRQPGGDAQACKATIQVLA